MATLSATLPQDTIDSLPESFQVELAGLSTDAQAQVVDAVAAANDSGDLADLNLDKTVADAQAADTGRERVEELHQEQAQAVADGDFAKADDLAHQTEYQLREVEAHGAAADPQIIQSEADQAHLDWAQYHQEIAQDASQAAAADAAAGDLTHAQAEADIAAGHGETAGYDAHQADQGGVSGDHGYDAAASVGADTSVADASASAE